METRYRSAGNRHEQERKKLAFDDRSAAPDKLGEVREFDVWMYRKYADDQNGDRAQLHVGGQIIAWLKQKPNGQHGCDQPVDSHQKRDLMGRERQGSGRRALSYPTPCDHTRNQQDYAEDARTGNRDLPRMAFKHPQSHDDGDGDRHADREYSPRAVRQGVHHDDSQTGKRYQENEQHGDHRDQTGEWTNLSPRNIGQGAASEPGRGHQNREVLNASRQHSPDQEPKETRGEAKLGCQSRPDERPGSRNRCEVMSE